MSKRNKDTHKRLRSFLDSESSSDDAFEKEAREGFSGFSEEDLMDSQQLLDKRMNDLLDQRKNSHYSYWIAAAALLIVASFAGFYLISSASEPRELSRQEQPRRLPPQSPEERTATFTDDDQGKAEAAAAPSRQPPAAKGKSIPEKAMSAADEAAGHEIQVAAELPSDTLVQDMVDAESGNFAEAVNTGVSVQEEIAVAREGGQENISSPKKKSSSGKERSARAAPSSAPAESAPPPGNAAINDNCYYARGEKALHSRLSDSLQRMALLQRFEARLFVNSKGKVDSVRIEHPHSLQAEQQKKVETLLRQLDGFVPANSRGTDTPAEFYLNFRP